MSSEMKKKIIDYAVHALSEFFGTGFLMLFGCMGCVRTDRFENTHLQMCFIFGLVVLISVQIFAHISGAHINPTVSVTALILGNLKWDMTIVHIISQCIGATAGYGVLKFLIPADAFHPAYQKHAVCVTVVNLDLNLVQGFFIEFWISLGLVWLCCAVWDPRNHNFKDSVSVRFGLAIAAFATVAGAFTGGSMNPARSLGPALVNLDFQDFWVYLTAPLIAAVAGAFFYKYIFADPNVFGKGKSKPEEG